MIIAHDQGRLVTFRGKMLLILILNIRSVFLLSVLKSNSKIVVAPYLLCFVIKWWKAKYLVVLKFFFLNLYWTKMCPAHETGINQLNCYTVYWTKYLLLQLLVYYCNIIFGVSDLITSTHPRIKNFTTFWPIMMSQGVKVWLFF